MVVLVIGASGDDGMVMVLVVVAMTVVVVEMVVRCYRW